VVVGVHQHAADLEIGNERNNPHRQQGCQHKAQQQTSADRAVQEGLYHRSVFRSETNKAPVARPDDIVTSLGGGQLLLGETIRSHAVKIVVAVERV